MSIKPLYVAGTLQDSGKTSISLGLMQAFADRGLKPGYMKPVGQRYVHHLGQAIDEDAYLFRKVFSLRDRATTMSPVAIKKRFTRTFIDNPDVAHLERRIMRCMARIKSRHGAVIVEGTGHAGVGSCFGLSNARVARLIGAKVVIVGGGGIGKPLDEIALNMALFERHGVEVAGVVLNKVIPRKFDEVKSFVSRGSTLIGTRLLGAAPYVPALTFYTMAQITDEFGYDVVCGRDYLHNPVVRTVVLAMRPEHSMKYIRENTLVIVPGDRTDTIRMATATIKNFSHSNGGIILTGCATVDRETRALLRGCDIPVLNSPEDTFKVSSRMVHLEFKIQASDRGKINRLRTMVAEHLDVDGLIRTLREEDA